MYKFNQRGEMAERSKAPESKVDALSKPFSALAQCVPANNPPSRNSVAPAGEGIAGKKMGFAVAPEASYFAGERSSTNLRKWRRFAQFLRRRSARQVHLVKLRANNVERVMVPPRLLD
jgi:hypothetical protein